MRSAGLLLRVLASQRSKGQTLSPTKTLPRGRINPSGPAMSAAIRSGELLACPAALLRRAPAAVGGAQVVSVRSRRARGCAVAVRAEATAEGVGKAKGGKKRPASGITKPKPISPELREFVGGAAELPRTEAIKLVWAHIKGNNLQDPNNKKIIVCDDKLKKIFGGRDCVGFLEISGLLNPHFPK